MFVGFAQGWSPNLRAFLPPSGLINPCCTLGIVYLPPKHPHRFWQTETAFPVAWQIFSWKVTAVTFFSLLSSVSNDHISHLRKSKIIDSNLLWEELCFPRDPVISVNRLSFFSGSTLPTNPPHRKKNTPVLVQGQIHSDTVTTWCLTNESNTLATPKTRPYYPDNERLSPEKGPLQKVKQSSKQHFSGGYVELLGGIYSTDIK